MVPPLKWEETVSVAGVALGIYGRSFHESGRPQSAIDSPGDLANLCLVGCVLVLSILWGREHRRETDR